MGDSLIKLGGAGTFRFLLSESFTYRCRRGIPASALVPPAGLGLPLGLNPLVVSLESSFLFFTTDYNGCPLRPIYTKYKPLHYVPNGCANVAIGRQVRHAGMIVVADESGMLAVAGSVRRLCQGAGRLLSGGCVRAQAGFCQAAVSGCRHAFAGASDMRLGCPKVLSCPAFGSDHGQLVGLWLGR
ncbi:hypothetical protein HAX54_029294 [Datura stramonium]|uniref:Uncharacterized protein n=1 Tax=Datura stramonium TaxID=4076 RepID=A0ABS8V5M4_DATST|nr:hypothetical protein [Datura stramonium]